MRSVLSVGKERIMATGSNMPSDIHGLTKTLPLSRRGFMSASAAAAAGYTLAAGPVRADSITTDTTGLDAGSASVKVDGGQMPIYFARPANTSKPPIILVAMEIFGLHTYIKDVTRRLGKLGALAVAPDYYFRQGNLADINTIPKLMPLVNAKPDAELLSDLDATVQWAESQGGDANRIGIIGFCRGGRTVWEYCAARDNMKAGVSFYGTLVDPDKQKAIWPKSPLELASQMKAPVLGLYGADDQGIPPSQVEQMKAALAAAGKQAEFKIYPGVGHGFHADYRPSYNKEAAEDAWQQMIAWFRKWNVLS
jgi:carboxymethylenebutenolidase